MFVDNCQSRRAARALCKRYGYDESEMFDALAAQEARTAGLMEGLALVNLLAALIEREEQLRLLRGEPSSPTRGHTVSQRPTDMVSIPNPYLARLHQHGGTLARIAEALKRCYMHDVDAARLAAQVGVGPRTLNGVLLRTTGRHLRDTVRRARVSAASYLLKCSSLSVGEIAGAVGYENPFAFSRAFRAVTGLSPSKYRKRQVYTNLSGE